VTKFSRWYKEIILPAGLLASLIIGAGIFALPFVFKQAGILVGLLYLIVFAAIFTAIHLMYAGIIENTPGKHRFPGYANVYFGRKGFWAGFLTTTIGYLLVLTVYIALVGSFIKLVAPSLGETISPIIFWLIGSTTIILSLRRLTGFGFIATTAIGTIILYLFIIGLFKTGSSLTPLINTSALFVPYGVVLFSLSGRAAISSIFEYFKNNKLSKNTIKKSIVLGTLIPAIIYFLFVISIIRLSGGDVSPDALSGLSGVSSFLLVLMGLLGILAIWTSYFLLGIEVKNTLHYDVRLSWALATLIVVFLPVLFYLLGLTNFIKLIDVIGAVFLASESAMVVAMYSKMRKWNIIRALIVFMFIVGGLYETYRFF
jgi:amino acid permease